MYIPPKVAKKNLLQYAESIGGKQMYMKMNKALRDANLHTEESLNQKQLDTVVDKLSEQEDSSIDKMKFKKLIDEKERRRQAYVKMAIESETDEMNSGSEIGGIGGFQGNQRYDFRKMPSSSNNAMSTAGHAPISSIGRLRNNTRSANGAKGSALGSKNTGPKNIQRPGPVSSISHIKR